MTSRQSISPRPPVPFSLSPSHFTGLAILYGLAVLYCSLLLGPDGLHFVPLSAAEAWQRFRAIHFVENGSDQRADWIANALMTIPLAYFIRGAVSRNYGTASENARAIVALAISVGFILAAKYAQLFFPPRTVTLNYIAAQSLGAILGVALFRFGYRQLFPSARTMFAKGDGLVIVLGVYSLLLAAFILMPFDLVLSPGDLAARFADVPLSIFPGSGHRPVYRAALVLADAAAMVPVGMFLAVTERESSFRALLWQGIGFVSIVTVLSLLMISTTPFALSLIDRPVGVVLGIRFILWLKGKDLWKRHYRYARYVPVVLPVYMLLLIWGNGLLVGRWLDVGQAIDAFDPRRLAPLWSLYVATKMDAAQTVVTTLAAYAPIGGMIWLRRGFWSRGAGFSAFVAFALSLAIELGRSLKPGLTPEFAEPFIAATGAALTFHAMPALWKLFELEAKTSILRDTYASKVARVGNVFGVVEVMSRPTALRREAADYADQLARALHRIDELEQTIVMLEHELELSRGATRKARSSIG